jgi:hypothetical protein
MITYLIFVVLRDMCHVIHFGSMNGSKLSSRVRRLTVETCVGNYDYSPNYLASLTDLLEALPPVLFSRSN